MTANKRIRLKGQQVRTTDRITVIHHPDGRINVEATAPLPLDEAHPNLGVYEGNVFDGFAGNNFAMANWRIGHGKISGLPAVEMLGPDEAEKYLTALAELVLAANGFPQ